MSSGGFYKYRCKNFYTYDCPNWVWINKSPCATCLAEGRDDDTCQVPAWMLWQDVGVPCVDNGVLKYTTMELVPTAPGEHWVFKEKEKEKARPPPTVPVTSAAVSCTSTSATSAQ